MFTLYICNHIGIFVYVRTFVFACVRVLCVTYVAIGVLGQDSLDVWHGAALGNGHSDPFDEVTTSQYPLDVAHGECQASTVVTTLVQSTSLASLSLSRRVSVRIK